MNCAWCWQTLWLPSHTVHCELSDGVILLTGWRRSFNASVLRWTFSTATTLSLRRDVYNSLRVFHLEPMLLIRWDVSRLCLTQVDRWRHSVSDVVEYVTTEKVTRIYFQHTSCIHMPVENSNTLGLYWLIISCGEAFFLKERMNISDSLHKLRISHRMSFNHYKQNTCVSQI
jgi:hypothetical protein